MILQDCTMSLGLLCNWLETGLCHAYFVLFFIFHYFFRTSKRDSDICQWDCLNDILLYIMHIFLTSMSNLLDLLSCLLEFDLHLSILICTLHDRILWSSLGSQGITRTPCWLNPNSRSAASNNLRNGGWLRYLTSTKNFLGSPCPIVMTEKYPSFILAILSFPLMVLQYLKGHLQRQRKTFWSCFPAFPRLRKELFFLHFALLSSLCLMSIFFPRFSPTMLILYRFFLCNGNRSSGGFILGVLAFPHWMSATVHVISSLWLFNLTSPYLMTCTWPLSGKLEAEKWILKNNCTFVLLLI